MRTIKSAGHVTLPAMVLAALIVGSPVIAQPLSRGWGPEMMMGPGMMGWRSMGRDVCDPRAAGLAQWRFDRMAQALQPTEAQRMALTELKAASTKAVEAISAACPREVPQSPVARLEIMERRLDTMLQAVKTVRPAFEALYSSLTDEQKAHPNSIGPRNWDWRRWIWPWNQS
jgi:hypothetical protein